MIRECISYNKIKKEDTDPHQRAKLVQQMMDAEDEKARLEEKSSFRFDRARNKIQILKDKVDAEETESDEDLNLQRNQALKDKLDEKLSTVPNLNHEPTDDISSALRIYQ